ncbi:DUF4031 domain-containing protein [Kocuria coralli]|uniref:DUF4031 domain-containing protein n=1 Tax=Kocuria coralli TaxID=1461025 RepID=UPI0015F2DECD
MPVYIDPPRWPAHGTEFSHLVSDTSLDELHEAAQRIGVSRRAFDRDHYDLPRERYDDAVAAGAIPVDGKELVRVLVASGLRIPAVRRNDKVLTALRRRWDRAFGETEALARLREVLLQAWGEEHRRYHDRTHLLAVLRSLDVLTEGAAPTEVTLAAWFHDAVHLGQAGDEEASALMAEAMLPVMGFSQEVTREVGRLVRLTTDHQTSEDDDAGGLLSDADLAVLGGTPAEYAAYVRRVREEYAEVPDTYFARARLSVLGSMDPSGLYRTGKARELWGAQARENLATEIDELALGASVHAAVPDGSALLSIVGVCFVRDGKLLTVRKRDTGMFMLVGGKREEGESAEAAAVREIAEEVGLTVAPDDLELLGHFVAPAANEAQTWVDSTVFVVAPEYVDADDGARPSPQAEIEELRYLDLSPAAVETAEAALAPLVRRQVLPMLRRRDRRFWPAFTGLDGPYLLEGR